MVLPINDETRPLCRDFYRGKCRRNSKCRFYHPKVITPTIKKEFHRERGKCFCGSMLKSIRNNRFIRDDAEAPIFFMVCGRTRKSIKRCR